MDSFLESRGIELNRELTRDEKRKVSSLVASQIVGTFASIKADYIDMFSALYATKMYFVDFPRNVSQVNYSYSDRALYISNKININKPNESLIFECLHALQDDSFGRIGLCHIRSGKGLILNEAVNQYIVNRVIGNKINYIDKLDIRINTHSKNHYPLETSLIEEIVTLIDDEDDLLDGALAANGTFENSLKSNFGSEAFKNIRDNLDKLFILRHSINKYNKTDVINEIKELYYSTQKTIYENYYNFVNLYDLEDAKAKLNELNILFENTESMNEFTVYYNERAKAVLEEESKRTALIVVDKKIFSTLFTKLKELTSLLKGSYNENSDK